MKETEDLIDLNDFKSINLRVTLWNKSTRTEIKDGQRSFGASFQAETGEDSDQEAFNMSILINEFLEDGLVLELPSKSCANGHNLKLEIVPENAPAEYKDFVFEGTATVSDLKKINPNRDEVLVQFDEFSDNSYKRLLEIFSSRQNEIQEFFEAVKG